MKKWLRIKGYLKSKNYQLKEKSTGEILIRGRDKRGRWKTSRWKILKQDLKERYPRVMLRGKDGKQYHCQVHQLVARVFHGKPPKYRNKKGKMVPMEVNHKDGFKRHNWHENLEYTSRKKNIEHSWKMGLASAKKGEKNGQSKITQLKAICIRVAYGFGKSQRSLGRQYGLSQSTIWAIVHNKIWKDVEYTKLEEKKCRLVQL